jgi:hypothetical protein
LRSRRRKGDMHCDVMMVVERVTVKRSMGKKGKGRGELEKGIFLPVLSTLIQDFNIHFLIQQPSSTTLQVSVVFHLTFFKRKIFQHL